MEALPVSQHKLRVATITDPVLSKVYRYIRDKWPRRIPECLRPFFNRKNELMVEEGCVLWGIRAVIPKKLREALLHELYPDHTGVTKMKSVTRSYMWWPSLDKYLEHVWHVNL